MVVEFGHDRIKSYEPMETLRRECKNRSEKDGTLERFTRHDMSKMAVVVAHVKL